LNLLELGLLLGEDADAEVSVLVRLEGGRDDQVLARRQAEAAAHLSQVDEGFGASGGGVPQEEVPVQVDVPLTAGLRGHDGDTTGTQQGHDRDTWGHDGDTTGTQ